MTDNVFSFAEFKRSLDANLSMHSQLADFFRQQIKIRNLKPGDKLVTEKEICEQLNISRTTVRLAMNALFDEELIVRFRGKGSYVAENKIRTKLDSMYSFSESMIEQGLTPSSHVLSATLIDAGSLIYKKLEIDDNHEKIFQLIRVRCGNNEPLLIETTYVPYKLCEGIEKTDFSKLSLYSVLKIRFGLDLYRAIETIDAILISSNEASLLNCSKKNTPGYSVERQSFLRNGQIFEYTTSVTRADRCNFRINLYSQSGGRPTVDFFRQLKAGQ